ncbi:MAG: hypothetical protein ACR2QK_07860 [Acidimicrobiales bacterium]
MTERTLTGQEQAAVEAWFVRRGLPNLIHDYRASTDVFTRAVPLLLVLWFFGIAGAYGERFVGWGQAVAALAGTAFLLAVGVGVNLLRGRRPLQVPDRVGALELAAFVLGPALLPVVLGNGSPTQFLLAALTGIAVLLLIWFIFGFGLGAIIRWAVGNLAAQLSGIVGLMIRTLPLLLVFTMFLFLNSELWQVADDFTAPLFLVATGGLVGVAVLFVLIRLPAELEDIGTFADEAEVLAALEHCDAPIETAAVHPSLVAPLSRTDRINVGILATFSLGVQVGLVMLIVGLFYVLFGLVTVRPNTIAQWTDGGSAELLLDATLFGARVPLTSELVKVAGFLMAFTALQFTVSALTDATYRQQFFDQLAGEIREALAVRVHYLALLPPQPPPTDRPGVGRSRRSQT